MRTAQSTLTTLHIHTALIQFRRFQDSPGDGDTGCQSSHSHSQLPKRRTKEGECRAAEWRGTSGRRDRESETTAERRASEEKIPQTVNGSWQVMAYVNVAEWKTDQVCEWLKGAQVYN